MLRMTIGIAANLLRAIGVLPKRVTWGSGKFGAFKYGEVV